MAEGNKRKKAAFFCKSGVKRAKTQFSLQPGLKGFIATCNFREKECVREAVNILSEFADKIYGEDKSVHVAEEQLNKKIIFENSESDSDIDHEDIEASLAKEVDELKQEYKSHPSKRRFQVVNSGADNCVFIRSTVEDPVCIVEAILSDIELKSKQKTRFLLRLLPIEITCKAWPEDIKPAAAKLFDRYFCGEPKTFCVVFKRRNNSNVLREELIQNLAEEIKLRNVLHRVDVKQPDLVVLVEVIRNICCMAVVPKYFHYRKYNLLEVAKLTSQSSNNFINKPKELNEDVDTAEKTKLHAPIKIEDVDTAEKTKSHAPMKVEDDTNQEHKHDENIDCSHISLPKKTTEESMTGSASATNVSGET